MRRPIDDPSYTDRAIERRVSDLIPVSPECASRDSSKQTPIRVAKVINSNRRKYSNRGRLIKEETGAGP